MPVTPFHFGPAALVKSASGKYFSFLAFATSQVLIDIEPLYYMAMNDWPIHRFLHTYAGATLAALLVIVFGKTVCGLLARLWNWRLSEDQYRWLAINPDIPRLALACGALFGAWSHVFLDSLMHSDMRPLAPFSDANSLLHLLGVDQLYRWCALAGLVGGVLLLVIVLRRKHRIESERAE